MGETVNTGGGMVNDGSINTGGGDVAARDLYKTTHIYASGYTLPSPVQISPPPADFVGRTAELAQLCAAVEQGGAIITGIQGLGGIGKTVLACRLADQLKARYPDGSLMLDLRGPDAPVPPQMILDRFIHAFYPTAKLPEDLPSLQALYRQALGGKRLILLLDNARGLEQVAPLLPPPAGCLALVTSRVHFTCAGMQALNLEVLPESDAVTLLRAIDPRITAAEAKTLAAACGYLPFALRVVASQLKVRPNLTPADMLRRMTNETKRLHLSGVEPVLEVSYQMLAPEQQAHWRKLAVFNGDFDLPPVPWVWGMVTDETTQAQDEDAARKAAKEAAQDAALETLGDLLAYSLVEYKDGRYALHDLARLFAGQKMAPAEAEAARLAHARYFSGYLSACNRLYKQGGAQIAKAVALCNRELGQISAAQRWCAVSETQETIVLCSEFPNKGVLVLDLLLHPREQVRWLEDALRAARQRVSRKLECYHLGNLGTAYFALGEPWRAIEYYEQALAIAREIGDRHSEGIALGNLGTAYADLGEPRRAIEYYEQAMAIHRETGDRRGEGQDLGSLGNAYFNLDEPWRAIEYQGQAMAIAREIGDRRSEGIALGSLGIMYKNLGEPRRAMAYYEQALAIHCEIGDRYNEAVSYWNLGLIYEQQGDLARAAALMQVGEDYLREIGHPDAEKRAARLAQLRARIAAGGPPDAA